MKAPFDIQTQLNSQMLPIMVRLPSTPPKHKQPSEIYPQNTIQYHNQMMLVETPIKEQQKFMDSLLESDRIQRQYYQEQKLPIMDEQYSENLFIDDSSEDIENRNPNLELPRQKTQDYLKPQMEIEENQELSNPTFKTPGRSNYSNAKSTTNKKKPCTCKKSGCLKKYCQCFKAGQVCNQNCDCIGCKNNDPFHLKSMTKSSIKTTQIMCNCKKSNCLKGYCDCHSAGMMCSQLCNCLDCKNLVSIPSQFGYTHTSKRSKKVHWNELPQQMQQQFVQK